MLVHVLQLKKMPDYSQLSIGQLESYKGSAEQSNERAVKHDHVAALYNHVRPFWFARLLQFDLSAPSNGRGLQVLCCTVLCAHDEDELIAPQSH